MDLSYINSNSKVHTEEFDKNTILYGPPGTGKTYHTVIYAIAIIEGKSIEEYANSFEAGDSITFWLTFQEVKDTYFN